jgi:hypothetical protein
MACHHGISSGDRGLRLHFGVSFGFDLRYDKTLVWDYLDADEIAWLE